MVRVHQQIVCTNNGSRLTMLTIRHLWGGEGQVQMYFDFGADLECRYEIFSRGTDEIIF